MGILSIRGILLFGGLYLGSLVFVDSIKAQTSNPPVKAFQGRMCSAPTVLKPWNAAEAVFHHPSTWCNLPLER